MLPTDGEIAAMRAVVETVQTHTATIQRNTPTNDGQLGRKQSWASVGTCACEVIPKRRRGEAEEAGRTQAVGDWLVRVPVGTSVTTKDRLVIDGLTYEILGLNPGRSVALSLELDCRRVD